MKRRLLLKGIGSLFAAPAIVKAEWLMPVKQIIPVNPFSMDRDWIISANGDIRYIGATDGKGSTVLEFHRWLQDVYDEPEMMVHPVPSSRSTDQIITLNHDYNIDAHGARHLREGTIFQKLGNWSSYWNL